MRLALEVDELRTEEAERIARELTDEQARTSAALSAERAAHVSTHEMLRHYRARIYELEDKQRSIDSGFTPLGIVPPQLPRQIVEEDARPTPKHGWPAWRRGKERKP